MLNRGRRAASLEFEGTIDAKGALAVPPPILNALPRGEAVHVRLTSRALSDALLVRGVSEEEIDRIAALQRESRDRVVSFLLSEGVLRRRRMPLRQRRKRR